MKQGLISKDWQKVVAFVEYAADTEGMVFTMKKVPVDRFAATYTADYAPEVVEALKRNFEQEYAMFGGGK